MERSSGKSFSLLPPLLHLSSFSSVSGFVQQELWTAWSRNLVLQKFKEHWAAGSSRNCWLTSLLTALPDLFLRAQPLLLHLGSSVRSKLALPELENEKLLSWKFLCSLLPLKAGTAGSSGASWVSWLESKIAAGNSKLFSPRSPRGTWGSCCHIPEYSQSLEWSSHVPNDQDNRRIKGVEVVEWLLWHCLIPAVSFEESKGNPKPAATAKRFCSTGYTLLNTSMDHENQKKKCWLFYL